MSETVRQLAERAHMLPWEKSPVDVPFDHRWNFHRAVTPELVCALYQAVDSARVALTKISETEPTAGVSVAGENAWLVHVIALDALGSFEELDKVPQ
jgi:hypothetical protein